MTGTYQFLERPVVSTSWKVTSLIFAIVSFLYIGYYDLLNVGTTLYLILLVLFNLSLFLLNRIVTVKVDDLTLSKNVRLGKWSLRQIEEVDVRVIQGIIVNELRIVQATTSVRSFHSVSGTGYDYKAFLKLENQQSFYLETASNRKEFVDQLSELASVLKVPLRDNSS